MHFFIISRIYLNSICTNFDMVPKSKIISVDFILLNIFYSIDMRYINGLAWKLHFFSLGPFNFLITDFIRFFTININVVNGRTFYIKQTHKLLLIWQKMKLILNFIFISAGTWIRLSGLPPLPQYWVNFSCPFQFSDVSKTLFNATVVWTPRKK